MATPTGQISMSDVNVEIQRAATASINFNDSSVRLLAGQTSGAVTMNNMRGKTFAWSGTFGGGTNVNLRTLANNAGYGGQPTAIINLTGTYNSSTTSAPAVEVGAWPSGTHVIIYISGPIIGKGGVGGTGGYHNSRAGTAGTAAGHAIQCSTGIAGGRIEFIMNGGYAYAGGGGGGGGGGFYRRGSNQDNPDVYSTGGNGGRGAGTDGGLTAGGAGTVNSGTTATTKCAGGNGGDYGAAGGAGVTGTTAGGAGGAGGYALLSWGNAAAPAGFNYRGAIG